MSRRALPVLLLALCACERKPLPAAADATPPAEVAARPVASAPAVEKVEVPEVRIRADAETTVHVAWQTPPGTAINDEAPFRIRWNRSDGLAEPPNDVKATGSTVKDGFRLKIRPMSGAPNATVSGDIDVVVCDARNHSVCLPVHRSVELGFVVVKDAATKATVSIPLPAVK